MAYTASLATQVSLAGGFGFIGTGTWHHFLLDHSQPVHHSLGAGENLQDTLEAARDLIHKEIGPQDILPIGVGFIGWIIDKKGDQVQELFSLLFQYRVKAVWLSFSNDLRRLVNLIHDLNEKNAGVHRVLIFATVSSLEQARAAIDWNVDVLNAQGMLILLKERTRGDPNAT